MAESYKKICVLIVCHKQYSLPDDSCYLPVEAGAALRDVHLNMTQDNTGDHISDKNRNYCELTALYWAWKNNDSDYTGLVHYRRYFGVRHRKHIVASTDDYAAALQKAPVILPKKRNYFIETNYSQYVHAHHADDLTVTREVLSEIYPEYLKAYDAMMKRTSGHRFNMFVMRRDIFNAYCEWLFQILFAVEQRLNISDYDAYNARVFGFIGERLLDCWIDKNQIKYSELPVMNTESQHWLKKGTAFLKRKFFPDNR